MITQPTHKIPQISILIYLILIAVSCGMFLYLDYIDIKLYYDDSYALQMIRWNMDEILAIITQSDLHPPLYYLMLKGYTLIFGDSIFVCRSFSTLAVLATMLLAAFPIRKRFGDRVGLSFLLLLIFFPITQFLTTEIRMYSWAMFFVLATAISAYDAYDKGRNADWLKLGLLTICSAYIHYYALLSVAWIFVALFIALLFNWRMKLKKLFLVIITCCVAYIPWLIYMAFQLERASVMQQYVPVSWYEKIYYFYYFYSIKKEWLPFSDSVKTMLMLGAAVILVLQLLLLIKTVIRAYKDNDRLAKIGLIAFLLFLMPILSGLFVSYFFYPILAARYMTAMFGLWIFAFAAFIACSFDSKVFRGISVAFIVFLALYGSLRFYSSQRHYKQWQEEYKQVSAFIGSSEDNQQIFLSEYYAAVAMSGLSVYYPENRFYVLIRKGWYDDFAPFRYEQINHEDPFASEFILVQRARQEDKGLGAAFKEALEQNFMTTDSIDAIGIMLFKMKARPIEEAPESVE